MKMAKATEADIDAAGQLLSLLDTISERFGGPWSTDGSSSLEDALATDEGESTSFNADNADHLRGLYNSLAKLLRETPGFHLRVIGGMCYVVLYDENQIVDPNSRTLDLHPRFSRLQQQYDELLTHLATVMDGDIGRCVQAKLATGNTMETADGKAWLSIIDKTKATVPSCQTDSLNHTQPAELR